MAKFKLGDEVTGINYEGFIGKFGEVVGFDFDGYTNWVVVQFEDASFTYGVLEENLDHVVYPEEFDPEVFVMEITTYWL